MLPPATPTPTLARATATGRAGTATPPSDAAGRVTATARMSVTRATHTATALPDGTVLIAGGCTADSCELGPEGASAEVYDPATGTFAATGRMTTARSGHVAAALPGGKVLLAAGWGDAGVLASAEVYDPATGRFAATGSLRTPRGAPSITPLRDGRVLIAGGFDGSRALASAELYDPRTGAFSPTGAMGAARSAHTATALPDGRVLVAGGSDDRDAVLASAEVFDPGSGRFTPAGAMTVVRYKHAAGALPGGRVLVVGGSDSVDARATHASAELWNPKTGAFSPTGGMATIRFKLTDAVASLGSGGVLVGGGGEHAELYDPASARFDMVEGSLGAEWSFATATPLGDGRVLIAGGYDAGINVTAGAWVYQPAESAARGWGGGGT